MIVVDASVVLDYLLGNAHEDIEPHLHQELAAPFLLDAEVGQVLRRFVLKGQLTAKRAAECFEDFADLPLVRYPHLPLMQRAFELRSQITFYDALYVALGEALSVAVLTRDRAFSSLKQVRAKVVVLS